MCIIKDGFKKTKNYKRMIKSSDTKSSLSLFKGSKDEWMTYFACNKNSCQSFIKGWKSIIKNSGASLRIKTFVQTIFYKVFCRTLTNDSTFLYDINADIQNKLWKINGRKNTRMIIPKLLSWGVLCIRITVQPSNVKNI